MATFSDDSVRMDLLRKYSKNRWGKLPEDVIPVTAADPDFQAAQPIREAIQRAAADGTFSYGSDGGNHEFRETVAETVKHRKGIDCTPDDIYATNGVAQAMMLTAKAFLKPGDEAILFDPVDFLFGKSIDHAEGRRLYSQVDWETRSFDLEGLKDLVTPRTRMLCICNPHNPNGRTLTKDELKAMVDLAVDHNLVIMSDEIWSDIIYDGRKHIATATLPDAADRTVSLYGFSKTFALAGLQLGYMVVTNPELLNTLRKVAPSYFYPVNNVSQEAGRAAYAEAWPWADAFLVHLHKVRDYGYGRLREMTGVEVHKPESTYVLFPKIDSFGMTSEEMTRYLLEEARVAVVPGHGEPFSYFGPGGEGHIRIVYSTSMGIIAEVMDRIEAALAKL
ncbi:MAG: pyridoxal phosphate-dependent aminotransferase [Candidatus Bathyarchaeota archaeon]|nr:pyridoxal phosphate-dependent aminotransferase [Candidatus Bathyarchaeota archaeon]